MKKLIKLESTKKFLFVYWQLTDFCNFKCNYCSPLLNEGNFSIKQSEKVPNGQQIFKFIKTVLNIDKDIYFSLSGGEPTIHPLFPEILKKIHNKSHVELITNGSRPIKWWKSLNCLPYLVRISLHPEYTDIKKINELSSFLINKGSIVRFNLSMDIKNWNKSVEMYELLDQDKKNFVRPKILHDWKSRAKPITRYNEEQINWIKNVTSKTEDGKESTNLVNFTKATYDTGIQSRLDFINASIHDNKYFNWKCSAGSTSISVNVLGQVHAGLCKQQLLGTIDNFNLLEDYLTCKSIFCQCPTDLLIPKYKQ